jgi:site-specific DNA-adenine methylase
MESKSKNELGQFYTTNYEYILQNLSIPTTETHIIEPFAGAGHLLNFVKELKTVIIEAYDIDVNNNINITERDTLKHPPEYSNKFVLTNPPYLARNKSKEKFLFNKYNTNDLYKCFIKQILSDVCNGGIIIIPLNFWCSIRKADIDLRKEFLENIML